MRHGEIVPVLLSDEVWKDPSNAIQGMLPITWGESDKIASPPSDGGALTTWTDLSGHGNSPTEANASYKPTYHLDVVNGLPVVRNAGNKMLKKTFTFTSPAHLFYVMKSDAYVANNYILFNGGVASNIALKTYTTAGNYLSLGSIDNARLNIPEMEERYCLVVIALYPSADNLSYVRVNGATRASKGIVGGNVGGLTLLNHINENTTTDPNSCAAFLMYPGILNSTNEAKIEKYFNDKYNLGIPINSTMQVTTTATKTLVTGTTEVIDSKNVDWHGRATCEVLSDGTVVMAYSSLDGHAGTVGGTHIKFSPDYGATWTAADKTLTGGDVVNSNQWGEPNLISAPNGDLILMTGRGWTEHLGTYQSTSTDGGETWSAESAITITGIVGDAGYMNLLDGYFIYDDVIYLSGRISTDAAETGVKSILVKSIDNGVNWTFVSDITPSVTTEVGIEYLGSNRIIAMLRSSQRAFSVNMGATWVWQGFIQGMLGNAAGKFRVYTDAHLRGETNWETDTHLIMCGFDIVGANRQICIWLSKDSGYTWVKFTLGTETTDGGYGDIFYNPLTGEYVYTTYQGTVLAADLEQFNFTVTW